MKNSEAAISSWREGDGGGGEQKFDDWEGVRLPIWGVTFAGGFSTPSHAMRELLKNINYRLWHWKN